MWRDKVALILFLLGLAVYFVVAQESRTLFKPKNCTIQCVHQETPGCEYCRISKEDVETTVGITSAGIFAGCVPWPCQTYLGLQNPDICLHYVHAPTNINIEFVENHNLEFDSVVVSWNPSQYGIAFLQGFQVTLQVLSGTQIACQLFFLQNNMSLSAVHSQRVYYSDVFTNLSLGTQYAVTVMALPVPETWNKFYQSKHFFTRTCSEKKSLEQCKTDWYPKHIEVHQESSDIFVTFNLAPEYMEIHRYFFSCFGGSFQRNYEVIQPNNAVNKTHHTYRLVNLSAEINYTCEIAADFVDAVRQTFFVQIRKEPSDLIEGSPSLAVLLSLSILFTVLLVIIVIILWQKRLKAKIDHPPDKIKEYYEKYMEECRHLILPNNTRPPRLLICYSSNDGSAHVKVVLHLAAFIQKHMATQVHLDMWDTFSILEEGALGWYCKRIKESDFVMVICSRGLNQRHEEESKDVNTTLAIVAMIAEEIFHTKALGQDLSKYMTVRFEYSKISDVPTMLNLASHYTLPGDFSLLFSRLHKVSLHKPGSFLLVEHISEKGYAKLPAGAALQLAIDDATILTAGLNSSNHNGDLTPT